MSLWHNHASESLVEHTDPRSAAWIWDISWEQTLVVRMQETPWGDNCTSMLCLGAVQNSRNWTISGTCVESTARENIRIHIRQFWNSQHFGFNIRCPDFNTKQYSKVHLTHSRRTHDSIQYIKSNIITEIKNSNILALLITRRLFPQEELKV